MDREPPARIAWVDPNDRYFPASWRDAAIRALFDRRVGGVFCVVCRRSFNGRQQLRLMEADHIKPWCEGGLTTWSNLQILCRRCNREKGRKFKNERL